MTPRLLDRWVKSRGENHHFGRVRAVVLGRQLERRSLRFGGAGIAGDDREPGSVVAVRDVGYDSRQHVHVVDQHDRGAVVQQALDGAADVGAPTQKDHSAGHGPTVPRVVLSGYSSLAVLPKKNC